MEKRGRRDTFEEEKRSLVNAAAALAQSMLVRPHVRTLPNRLPSINWFCRQIYK